MKILNIYIKYKLSLHNFKKYFLILLVSILLVSCSKNEIDGFRKKPFYIEVDAKLNVPVPSDLAGEVVLSMWQEKYPNIELTYQVVNEDHLMGFDNSLDLFYGDLSLMALHHDSLLTLDDSFKRISNVKEIKHLSNIINFNKLVFMPFDLSGFMLAYNKKIMEELDDEFSNNKLTFENILELNIEDTEYELLALAFNDMQSFYGFLTIAGWGVFPPVLIQNHNLNDSRLKKALEFIEKLGSKQAFKITNEWHYETALLYNSSLFTLVGTWPTHQNLLNEDWVIMERFPSYQGQTGQQLVNVSGYAINENTKYPGAAKTFLQFINTKHVKLSLADDEGFYPVVLSSWLKDSSISENKQSMLMALASGQPPAVNSLNNNPSKFVFDIMYDIEILPIIEEVYNQNLSVESAMRKITEMADKWLTDYDNR